MAYSMEQLQPYFDWIDSQLKEMLRLVTIWSRINSHSKNPEGLRQMLEALKESFTILGADREIIPLEEGHALSFVKRPDAKLKILFMGHYDTVYPVSSPFQDIELQGTNRLHGPAVADMKGGLVILLKALQALEFTPFARDIGWEILLNPDEEIGSPYSKSLIMERAKGYELGLIFEPSSPEGVLVSERKGSSNFTLTAKGISAHVGRHFNEGVSAINALSECIVALEKLSHGDLTVNVGVAYGGTANNVVPDFAYCTFNIRGSRAKDLHNTEKKIRGIIARIQKKRPGTLLTLEENSSRPPKPFNEKTEALFNTLKKVGDHLNIPISWKPSGGVCDGNLLSAAGIPSIDTLGAVGGKIHTHDEYLDITSLVERTKLVLLFLLEYSNKSI